MLTNISLKNYKPIRFLDCELKPLTAFIGPNDSGKSSILQAMHHAARVASGFPVNDIFTGMHQLDQVRNQAASGEVSMAFAGRFPDIGQCKWSFNLTEDEDSLCRISKESWEIGGDGQTHPEPAARNNLPDALAAHFGSATYLHFDPNQLKAPSYSDEDAPRLEYDGSGLPSVLAVMQGLARERFDELEARFKAIVPTVERILVGPGPVYRNETETIRIDNEAVTRTHRRRYTGHCLYFDTVSGRRIPAPHMSDGGMLILGFLAALMSDATPNLILLEEPENGVHPKALEPFMNFFRTCLKQEGVQILLTSHSPYLVDCLDPEEIILTRRASGFTEAVRMDALPDIKEWMENLSPGELWTMGGEAELTRLP